MVVQPRLVLYYLKGAEYKAHKALVAAAFNSIKVESVEFEEKYAQEPAFKVVNPAGKLPYMTTERGGIFCSNAIARYIGRLRRDNGLHGETFVDSAHVDQWLEFSIQDLEVPCTVVQLPVEYGGPAIAKAFQDLQALLERIEIVLKKSSCKFLVGSDITLADIVVVCSLVGVMTKVVGPQLRGHFPEVVKWYQKCIETKHFQSVIGPHAAKLADKDFDVPKNAPVPASLVGTLLKNENTIKEDPKKQAKQGKQEKKERAPAKKLEPQRVESSITPSNTAAVSATAEDLTALEAIKNKVRELKTAGAEKSVIDEAVSEMKRLKILCGEEDGSKSKKKKK